VDLSPAQFLTDIADAAALLEAEQGAVDHMNADHRDTMNLYATRLLGAQPAEWRCTGCDPDGIDIQAGATTLRLDSRGGSSPPPHCGKYLKSSPIGPALQQAIEPKRGPLRINQIPRISLASFAVDQ